MDGAGGPRRKRPRVEENPFEALKTAYMMAVSGDAPEEECHDLHQQIMEARPGARGHAGAAAAALLTEFGQDKEPTIVSDRDAARLFVGGLPHDCTEDELKRLFDQVQFSIDPQYCEVLECRVLRAKGCGYVRYNSWEAAEAALNQLQGRDVDGWDEPLRVKWATPRPSDRGREETAKRPSAPTHGSGGGGDAPNVLEALSALGGLLGAASSKQQHRHQQQANAGGLSDLLSTLLTAKSSDRSSGGRSTRGAPPRAVLSEVHPGEEDSVWGQGLDPKRLFIGQIRRGQSEHALREVFEPFGRIVSMKFLEDKGIAYVQYEEFASAKTAVATLDKKIIQDVSTRDGLNVQFSKLR